MTERERERREDDYGLGRQEGGSFVKSQSLTLVVGIGKRDIRRFKATLVVVQGMWSRVLATANDNNAKETDTNTISFLTNLLRPSISLLIFE
jgi:hypothetical protein